MELRRWSFVLAIFLLAVLSQTTEARHSIERRATDYSEVPQRDASDEEMLNDYGQQNDGDGGDDEEDVIENASIITTSNNYKLNVGTTVRLECRTQPAAGPIIRWKKNKDTILFFGNNKINADPRYSLDNFDLMIRDMVPADSGMYTCEVMQTEPTNITHHVIVTEPARIIRFDATNKKALEGEDVLLTCEVTGNPKPTIYWSRSTDGGKTTTGLTDADGTFSKNTFFMKNVRREQAGIYYCLVANSEGPEKQQPAIESITISVVGKPRVHAHKTVVNSNIGTEAELICTTHTNYGEFAPTIQWYKDERTIENAGVSNYRVSTEGARSTLTVIPEKDTDFGRYMCKATNEHGHHSRVIDLVQHPVVEDLDVDGPKLTWTVHSHQPIDTMELHLRNVNDTEWLVNPVPIPTSTNGRKYEVIYEIKNSYIKDGTYEAQVRVKNEKGWNNRGEPVMVNLDSHPQSIQAATVLGAGSGTNGLFRPSAILSTILMYLLVRMF